MLPDPLLPVTAVVVPLLELPPVDPPFVEVPPLRVAVSASRSFSSVSPRLYTVPVWPGEEEPLVAPVPVWVDDAVLPVLAEDVPLSVSADSTDCISVISLEPTPPVPEPLLPPEASLSPSVSVCPVLCVAVPGLLLPVNSENTMLSDSPCDVLPLVDAFPLVEAVEELPVEEGVQSI